MIQLPANTQVILYWVLVGVMVFGVFGALIPGIPGVPLIVAAIVIWGVIKGFAGITVPLIVAIGALLLSLAVDFLAVAWGAQKAGASKWGQLGAFVGVIVGTLGLLPALPFGGPLVGLLLGAILGAVIGEYLYRKDFKIAVKAAAGIIVGSLIGNLVQVVIAIVTVLLFVWSTLPQVMS